MVQILFGGKMGPTWLDEKHMRAGGPRQWHGGLGGARQERRWALVTLDILLGDVGFL